MMKPEYIFLNPTSIDNKSFSAREYMDWADRVKEMHAWCSEQGFNWYIDKLPNGEGVKFQFDWPEDLTLFLLRWS